MFTILGLTVISAELKVLNPVGIFILVQTENTYEQSFHLGEISALSQQTQSQQAPVVLSRPEGNPTDFGSADLEVNTTTAHELGEIDVISSAL
jgi:hypothetical protein